MDFKTALEILEVSEPYTKKILKKQYFKKALIYHPDKNSDPDSNTKFHKIQEAYRNHIYKTHKEIMCVCV